MRFSPWLLVLLTPAARADTVVLANGKKISDVTVSRDDDRGVVINPWNSRCPDMTFEIPKEDVLAREKVKEVIVEDPPRVAYLRGAVKPGLDAEGHFQLAQFCTEKGLKPEAQYELEQTLLLDPQHAGALAAYGEMKWKTVLTRNPGWSAEARAKEAEYVAAATPEEAEPIFAELAKLGSKRPHAWLERARRSAQLPKGRRDKVRLTIDSASAPGATYAIYVPKSYDPLRATPLVIALHGGGRGGEDKTLVTGSGEDALNFYVDLSEESGFIVACPTALIAPWQDKPNHPLLRALIEEMKLLYDVDVTRIYVTGHSMGGFGSWYFGPSWPEVWAACAPCAGGPSGRVSEITLPVYIYHGADDPVVGVERDRDMARTLRGDGKTASKVDFVYTELDKVGHSFPDWVRHDIFRWFAGRAKPNSKKGTAGPESSFDAKVGKAEIDAFGDPSKAGAETDAPASLKALLAELKQGGGNGEKARDQLAATKDPKTAKAVAALLANPDKTSADTRVLAVQTLGIMALKDCTKLLAPAIQDPDHRVVDAATEAFAKIGATDAAAIVDPLQKLARRLGEFWQASLATGRSGAIELSHTEYAVRLDGFGLWLRAVEVAGKPEIFLPLIESQIVVPIFAPKTPYSIPADQDERFKRESPAARLKLMQSLCACLVKLGDPKGKELLQKAVERWPNEPKLAAEAQAASEQL